MGVVILSHRDEDVRRSRFAVDRGGVAAGPSGRTTGLDLFAAIKSMALATRGRPLIRRASRRDVLEERPDRVDGVSSVVATTSSGVGPSDNHARLARIGCGAPATRGSHVA